MPNETNSVPHVHRTGVFRRELLQVGFLGAMGMMLPDALAASPSRQGPKANMYPGLDAGRPAADAFVGP